MKLGMTKPNTHVSTWFQMTRPKMSKFYTLNTAIPELDNRVLQRPEVSACMHELSAQPEHAEATHVETLSHLQMLKSQHLMHIGGHANVLSPTCSPFLCTLNHHMEHFCYIDQDSYFFPSFLGYRIVVHSF